MGGVLIATLTVHSSAVLSVVDALSIIGVAHADYGSGGPNGEASDGPNGTGAGGTGEGGGSVGGGGYDQGYGSLDQSHSAYGEPTGIDANCNGFCGGGNDGDSGSGSPYGTNAPTCPDGSLAPSNFVCQSENAGGGCYTTYGPCTTSTAPPPAAPTCPDGNPQPSHKNCNLTGIFSALCPVIYDACPVPPPTAPSTPPPTSPTNLSGSCTDTTAQVSWTGGPTDTSYDLRVNDKSDGWSDVGPCSAQSSNDICIDNYPSTSKTFTGQLGHTYEWWVHGVNAAGDVSDPAGGSLFTCTPTTPPSPPTNYTATCDATSGTPLTMRWDASAGATVYAASLILPPGSSCPDASWTTSLVTGNYVGCQKAVSGYTVTANVPLDAPITAAVYAGNPSAGYNIVPAPATGARITCSLTPTAALTASPDTVTQGNSSTLSWSSTNATSCVFADSPSTPRATSGTRSVTPATTSTYSVTCSNASKTSAPAQATVTVLSPTVSITANPTRTLSDGKTTVSWNATEVNTCNITKNGVAWKTNLTDPSHTITGSSPDIISGQTLYKMTCEDLSASTQADSVVVNTGSGGFQEF